MTSSDFIDMAEYFFLGLIIGAVVFTILVVVFYNGLLKEMGDMVCKENNKGTYVSFDSENKIIKCKEPPQMTRYDDGYIQTTTGDER